MWLGIFSGIFSVPAVAGLLWGLRNAGQAAQRGQIPWGWLAWLALLLTGRHWVRRLRPRSQNAPRPLRPTRRGVAFGRGGVRLEWEEHGPPDQPAVLLTHGWSLTLDTWEYQTRALAGEFRVIVWNMRGTGGSEKPPDSDYSMEAVTDDLAAVFDASGAGRHPRGCVLAGHSVGAMILPLFAARFPERMGAVRGLALLAGTDAPLLQTMWGRQWLVPLRYPFWEPLARTMGRFPTPFEWYVRLIRQMGCIQAALIFATFRGRDSREQDDLVADRCAAFSMRAAGLGALACFAFDARAETAQVTVPTLLLTGECDRNMPPDSQRALAGRLRQPEVEIIPGCGHLALLECHEEVSARLTDFARRCLRK